MARRSVLALIGAAVFVSACVSIAPQSTPVTPDFSFTLPSIPPVVIPTIPPEPTTTAQPTPSPQPTATPQPTQPPATTPTPQDRSSHATAPPSIGPSGEPPGSGGPGISPPASPIDLGPFLTTTVGLVNLSDSDVAIDLDIYSDGQDQGTIAHKDMTPFGSIFQKVLEATYLATFKQGDATPLTCTFTAKTGEEIDFTVVNGDILVAKVGSPPATPDDLFVATSSLCAATGA